MSETDPQGHSQGTLQDIITKQGESGDRGGVGVVVGVSMHIPTLENFTALHDQYSLLRKSLGTEWLIYAHFVIIKCPYSVIFLARNLLKGESALEAVITNNALQHQLVRLFASSQDVKQV